MSQDLIYEVKDRVGYITINRAEQRNAITPEAISLFHKYLDEAEKDADVRVIQVTGAGDRAFCTGAQLGDGMSGDGENVFNDYAKLLRRLAEYSKPTVARIKGYCLAGGTGFMLACDIVVASDDSKFGTPEVNVGLWPMMIGALIFRNVNRKKAMDMILTGDRLNAAQALEMGLVSRVVAADSLEEELGKLLANLAAKSPIGMKLGKDAFNAVEGMELGKSLDFLAVKLAEIASTEDAKEGITAFIQKRKPVFTGK